MSSKTGPGGHDALNDERTAGETRLNDSVEAYQAAVDDFDRECARVLGVNETDLRCLEILLREVEESSPTDLSDRLGLTTGSVTTMLDRLERAGYLTRAAHPTDRRKSVVRATPQAATRAHELIGPLVDGARSEVLAHFGPEQLDVITDFLDRARDLTRQHIERLRTTEPTRTRTGSTTARG
ncbi:MarR family winged helix-turn-helix transcriptional regulator [Kitasatospora sp. NPDC059577]|uniref:MarR family winged helix-turn-helix transcriptional regulator n=1 Tax=unclassified Kitasatospora TaxID=2633591 RepID=UPI003690E50C